MKNKNIEKRILVSLEDKRESLNPRIMDAVKQEIREEKRVKLHKTAIKFAVATCLVVIICLSVVLTIVLTKTPSNAHTRTEFASMQDYVYTQTACYLFRLDNNIVCVEETY